MLKTDCKEIFWKNLVLVLLEEEPKMSFLKFLWQINALKFF